MPKLSVRFLILSMFTAALLVGPVITQAHAATTSSKHMKKSKVRVVHQAPRAKDPNANPFGSNYEDDIDRKRGGGGGGY